MKITQSAFGIRGEAKSEPLGQGQVADETEHIAIPDRGQLTFEDDSVAVEEGLALRLGGRIAPCRIAYRLVGA